MSHTTGPWKFEPGTKTIRSEPANYWLATMDSWDGAVDHEANARLIAAAPDLLAALQDITDHFSDVMEGPAIKSIGIIFPNGVENIPTIKQAREAIAKATQ